MLLKAHMPVRIKPLYHKMYQQLQIEICRRQHHIPILINWGRVTDIWVSKQTIIGSYNG